MYGEWSLEFRVWRWVDGYVIDEWIDDDRMEDGGRRTKTTGFATRVI